MNITIEQTEVSKPLPGASLATAKQSKRLALIDATLPSAKNLFRRVFEGVASPRQCIKAFCLECNGFEKESIPECTADACPLWRLRPYQRKSR